MFLKRLEILGFKSFADRTVVEFTDGITVLLGPNGCGKSNIVDAIQWVLGEQSVRSLRASRMDDVIFSGTETRKSLSVAEVTLVLSNEQGLLEIDRPEISIKRRIYREGESEYFINGATVRLKDVRELFFDTGVGKSAYSVMEQGRIDQVLSNRPDERRHLFEEAAGITKYKMRGTEAERKLLQTKENIGQVENILREVQRTYESLEKQTRKTMQYRKLKESAFNCDRDLKLLQWRDFENSTEKQTTNLGKIESHLKTVDGEIAEIRKTLANELDSVNTMESRLIDIQKELYGTDVEMSNLEARNLSIEEQRGKTDEILQAALTREKHADESFEKLKNRRAGRESELNQFKSRLVEIQKNVESCKEAIKTAEDHIRANIEVSAQVSALLKTEEKNRENLQESLRKLTDDIVSELDRRLKESSYDRNTRHQLEESLLKQIEEIKIRVDGRLKLLSDKKSFSSMSDKPSLDSVLLDFSEIQNSMQELSKLFENYKSSGSNFLEDFLAPQGIITQKRELDGKISASSRRIADGRKRISSLDEEVHLLREKVSGMRERLEELRVSQTRTASQVSAAKEALSSLEREIMSEEARLGEIRKQITVERERINTFDEQIDDLEKRKVELEKKRTRLRKTLEELEIGINKENKKMAGREDQLKSNLIKRNQLELDMEKKSIQIEHIEGEIKHLHENFLERYSRDLSEFQEHKSSIKLNSREAREAFNLSKTQLKELGHVNLMAPEEFNEVSERYEFLNKQLSDLRTAREDLLSVTEEIQRETSKQFIEIYNEIRNYFHDVFRRLFGGGRAEIRLSNVEDPLNSGIEIYAQPPGKKLENISLLSGGEKSLCGVALMFATYLVKPSPFCILDEIDAALDEANIQRFVTLLSEFGEKSQFVVITHNKKTVAGARTLLGVTMQESGVSRLIALKLEGEEEISNDERVDSNK